MIEKDWYIIDDIEKLDTPVLVVYPERVKHNIRVLKTMVDDVSRLRPHAKTHKSPDASRLLLQAGISKFKCATIAEAEMLAICSAPDVLLAYQPIGPKLDRFVKLILTYPKTKFSCLIDNLKAADEISALAEKSKIKIDVYIDLNLGQNRTGISPDDTALKLYIESKNLSGINLRGLHAYDGHIHDAEFEIRKKRSNDCFDLVLKLNTEITNSGFEEPIIIAGGSPTFPIHAERKDVECSPGTFIYWDRGYQTTLVEQDFLPAVLVIARIISLPDDSKICLDLGHKSISAENNIDKRVYFINAPALQFIGHSEEHLVAEVGDSHNFKIGDVLYGMPYHVCPTVALYERAISVENNQISGEWKNSARDRKITV